MASIIEKAAGMLDSLRKPNRTPAKSAAKEDPVAPDPVERAAGPPPESGEAGDVAPEAEGKRQSALSTNRLQLQIDLNRLRQQNILTPDEARTPIAECFRRIKRPVLANAFSPAVKSKDGAATNLIMLTSALPGEGKTFCTVNLAISIAMELDRTVLLVDADVANPSVLKTLGLEARLGLMDVLADRSIELADVLCRTNIGDLTLLPAGTPHRRATEMLASEAMLALLREMSERYPDRIIIFDSPPLLLASEASVLASRMSQVLLVVEEGVTSETALQEALNRVSSCENVGLVLNKGGLLGPGYSYGPGYGYGYGYGDGG